MSGEGQSRILFTQRRKERKAKKIIFLIFAIFAPLREINFPSIERVRFRPPDLTRPEAMIYII